MTYFVRRLSMVYCLLPTPTSILRHGHWLCIFPAILTEVGFQCEQAWMEFAKRGNVRIISFSVEEVEHGFHLFLRTPSTSTRGHGELYRSADHFRKRVCDLGFGQGVASQLDGFFKISIAVGKRQRRKHGDILHCDQLAFLLRTQSKRIERAIRNGGTLPIEVLKECCGTQNGI